MNPDKNGAEKKKRGMFTFLIASPLLALSLSLTHSLVYSHTEERERLLFTLSATFPSQSTSPVSLIHFIKKAP